MKTSRANLFAVLFVCLSAGNSWAQEWTTAQADVSAAGFSTSSSQILPPRLIRFSGNVPGAENGSTYSVTFSIYDQQVGGTPIWQEVQTVSPDANGRFVVLLGVTSREGLPSALFSAHQAQWLGVQLDAEESPRIMLISVPYAIKAYDADTLGGLTAAELVASARQLDSGAPKTAQRIQAASGAGVEISSSPVITDGGGSVGALARWTGSDTLGTSSVFDTGAFVGIGTDSPGAILDVNGLLHIGNRLQQTAGFERFILGQNSVIGGGADGNMVEFRITHALPSGSPSTGLLYQFRQNNNSGANLYGFSMKQTKTSGEDSTFLTFETNSTEGPGVERLRIDKNGNVGIATTAPNARLEVVSGVSETRLSYGPSSGGILQLRPKSDGSTDIQMNAYTGSPKLRILASNAVELFSLANISGDAVFAGNVGLGKALPTSKLDVVVGNSAQGVSVTQTGAGALSFSVGTPPPVAIRGDATSASGVTAGVLGITSAVLGRGVIGESLSTTGQNAGVYGVAVNSPEGAGLWGEATSTSGDAVGVFGRSSSSTGTGVLGQATATSGDAAGVAGLSSAAGGTGILGEVTASSGENYGVSGRVFNNTVVGSTAGMFINTNTNAATGSLLLGRTSTSPVAANVFRIDTAGKGFFNGGTQTSGADFAESVTVKDAKSEYQPGDVIAIDTTGERRFAKVAHPYSTLVAGIYSTKPGVLATPHAMEDARIATEEIPLAVVGIVPCKVTNENGEIHAGDLLVSSSREGYAMRGTDRKRMNGAVIGKALQPMTGSTGVIEVLVSLQ